MGLDHASMIVNVSESMQGSSPQVDEVLLTQGRILIEHVQLNADDWDLFKMVRTEKADDWDLFKLVRTEKAMLCQC